MRKSFAEKQLWPTPEHHHNDRPSTMKRECRPRNYNFSCTSRPRCSSHFEAAPDSIIEFHLFAQYRINCEKRGRHRRGDPE